ncbi:MAG: hypothetical protein DRP97_02135, partial [Candidatus Latescibacterota bacterium]
MQKRFNNAYAEAFDHSLSSAIFASFLVAFPSRKGVDMIKKSINQWAFAKDTAKGCMELAKDAGFEAIELALAEDGDITLNSTETEIRALRETANRIEIELASLATGLFWSYSLTSNDADTRKKALDVAKKELEVAAWLGVDAILV